MAEIGQTVLPEMFSKLRRIYVQEKSLELELNSTDNSFASCK